MVTLLTRLSLPTDIQQQTIYTVVSKPVRRIELIWGRMLGFMTIVTFLVLVFGGFVCSTSAHGRRHDHGDRGGAVKEAKAEEFRSGQSPEGRGGPAPRADVGS